MQQINNGNGTLRGDDSIILRFVAYTILILFVSAGVILGTLIMFSVGVLTVGGIKLLKDVWEQSNAYLFLFFLLSIAVGGSSGGALGAYCSRPLVRRRKLLSDLPKSTNSTDEQSSE